MILKAIYYPYLFHLLSFLKFSELYIAGNAVQFFRAVVLLWQASSKWCWGLHKGTTLKMFLVLENTFVMYSLLYKSVIEWAISCFLLTISQFFSLRHVLPVRFYFSITVIILLSFCIVIFFSLQNLFRYLPWVFYCLLYIFHSLKCSFMLRHCFYSLRLHLVSNMGILSIIWWICSIC